MEDGGWGESQQLLFQKQLKATVKEEICLTRTRVSTSTENKLYFRLQLSTCYALPGLTFIKLGEVRAAGYLHLGDIKSGFRKPKIESSEQVAVQALTALGGWS